MKDKILFQTWWWIDNDLLQAFSHTRFNGNDRIGEKTSHFGVKVVYIMEEIVQKWAFKAGQSSIRNRYVGY